MKNSSEIATLKAVIKILIGKWKIIASVMLAITFVTAIFNFLVIRPEYLCETEVTVKVPKTLNTEMGEYELGTIYAEDLTGFLQEEVIADMTIRDRHLIDITAEDFIKTISFTYSGLNRKSGDGPIIINIGLRSRIAKDLDNIASRYAENYVEYLKVYYKRAAVFDNLALCGISKETYSTDLGAKQFQLAEITKVIAATPRLITVREAVLEDPDQYDPVTSGSDTPVTKDNASELKLVEIVNPAYAALEDETAILKLEIAELQSQVAKIDQLIVKYENETGSITTFLQSGDASGLDNGVANILDSRALVTASAEPADEPVSPRKLRNILVAAILSAVLGMIGALSAYYWKKF
ncbi:MAG: GumC domain-containing protein [Saccharofermentanales bacterium]